MIGNIPENLVYFVQKAKKISTKWDDIKDCNINKITVYPVYVSDATNKKTLKSGEDWAKGGFYHNENEMKEKIEMLNAPILDIKIVGLEYRNQGGRAYKVLIDDKYYVDLREDVLLEAMMQTGIEPMGSYAKLNGGFIWAKVGSQMKLIRDGSKLHEELIAATNRRKKEPIKNLDLYGMYSNQKGNRFIYLGKMNTTNVYYKHGNFNRFKLETNEIKNVHCFLDFPDFYKDKELEDILNDGCHVIFQKTFTFREKPAPYRSSCP